MAGSASGSAFHLLHGCPFTVAIWEQFGVAIAAFINFSMKGVAEVSGDRAGLAFKGQLCRFHTFVAFVTITR